MKIHLRRILKLSLQSCNFFCWDGKMSIEKMEVSEKRELAPFVYWFMITASTLMFTTNFKLLKYEF